MQSGESDIVDTVDTVAPNVADATLILPTCSTCHLSNSLEAPQSRWSSAASALPLAAQSPATSLLHPDHVLTTHAA
ncbi:hypothetical protein J1614_007878 [Plenodomus biglobosus]|nr:hypothetical protein J1614_007878 [Plenodomus biglobosus]